MSKWQSSKQQWIYGRRLIEALRAARSGRTGPCVIKKAADSALALSVRGQSRWSRAILFGPCKPKVKLKACSRIPRHRPFLSPGKLAGAQMKGRKVRGRLRVLSRLVPGCKKLPAASVLSETADYVAALQMRVGLALSQHYARAC
ncbi:hypothetical protein M5K25_024682 [Dendrobium thyrsiflorum]|uniref:BHLH domain-containing protein n=1 Tax=Dendrobium thyrsiflorum TaxID=117978 RepID=A0ABD0U2V6_DENTH